VSGRRRFLAAAGLAASGLLLPGCRRRGASGKIVLRLSHSQAPERTALDVLAHCFQERVAALSAGAVEVRIFPNGSLGQEREVVQQVQEGLIDLMASGSAIWGSVAPKLQILDLPFVWRDDAHINKVIEGGVGQVLADHLLEKTGVHVLGWGGSFGFRNVVTRRKEVRSVADLAGLKIRTIQTTIYLKAVELMGASPTPMAFGEVYTSLETGVIDGFEHDASTTLAQRFYEVSRYVARTEHIPGVLGIWISGKTLARLPADLKTALLVAGREAGAQQRAMGPAEDKKAVAELVAKQMTFHDIDRAPLLARARPFCAAFAQEIGAEGLLRSVGA
jgi:tripartite ATP-independent transporter DctP family solute receptor